MKYTLISAIVFLLIFYGCSASTGSRYEKTEKEEKKEVKEEIPKITPETEENFDFTPFREDFEFEEIPDNPIKSEDLDLWFTYEEDTSIQSENKEIIDQVDGYRVQVIATDNLEEANQIRSEIYFKTNQKSVYISFEPPFYKVKAGDFTRISDARDFNFKLSQMGYKESKIISERVNVFK